MTELHRQVQRAQRRLTLQTFLTSSIWSLSACLAIAMVALLVTKLRFVGVDATTWAAAWLGGAVVLGLLGSAVWTWVKHASLSEAAFEIDHRFGLKERVSSSLSLTPDEADSQIGQALVADAARRVERIDVREKFSVNASRWAVLPVVTAALAVGLVFLPDAVPQNSSTQATAKTVEVDRVKKSTTQLKKKLEKKRELLDKQNLKEASELAEKLEKGLDELAKTDAGKKKTMVEMNNLAKEIQERRDSLQGSEELKKKLNQLKGIKVKEGPAEKLAKAMQNGDFQKALEQIKKLQSQLKNAQLSPKQQEQLTQQMQQMQRQLNEMAKQHEETKQNLQDQIAKAKAQGNKAAAEKLQKKLNQMMAQDAAMKRLQKLAEQMDQVAQKMQQGDQQQAMEQLQQMAADLESMQQQMSELDALDDLMQQLASAKDSMNCGQCDGSGCQFCQGFGNFGQQEGFGRGLGEGQGRGDRPEEKTDVRFHNSRVAGNVEKGKMVVKGFLQGPNKPGEALEAIKEAMSAEQVNDENPLQNVRLTRGQREQAQQYFDMIRDGREN